MITARWEDSIIKDPPNIIITSILNNVALVHDHYPVIVADMFKVMFRCNEGKVSLELLVQGFKAGSRQDSPPLVQNLYPGLFQQVSLVEREKIMYFRKYEKVFKKL